MPQTGIMPPTANRRRRPPSPRGPPGAGLFGCQAARLGGIFRRLAEHRAALALLQRMADEGEDPVEAVDELAVGHAEEKTQHAAEVQQQQHAEKLAATQGGEQQEGQRGGDQDRKRVMSGKSGSVQESHGGRQISKKKKHDYNETKKQRAKE